MYNSQNLPLSLKKVIKKTIAKGIGYFPLIIFIIIFRLLSKETGVTFFSGYTGLLLIFLGLIFSISLFYEYLYYKLYYYDFGENKAEIRKGVIRRATGYVRYERLQNIYIDQDFWDRILGLYDVHYETAGETSGFYSHVDGLIKENADKLVAFLDQKTNSYTASPPTSQQSPQEEISGKKEEVETEISRENYSISPSIILIGIIRTMIAITILLTILYGYLYGLFYGSDLIIAFTGKNVLFLSVLMVLTLLNIIYNYVWYKNFYFSFGEKRGEIKTKVIGQSISYLYYDRIQNVNINQGILERIFGIYSLSIETAGEKTSRRLNIPGLDQPSAEIIKEFFLRKSEKYKERL